MQIVGRLVLSLRCWPTPMQQVALHHAGRQQGLGPTLGVREGEYEV